MPCPHNAKDPEDHKEKGYSTPALLREQGLDLPHHGTPLSAVGLELQRPGRGGLSDEGDNEHASISLRSDISQQQADSGVVKEGGGARAWPDQGCPQFLDPWTNSISSNMDPHLTNHNTRDLKIHP